MNDEMRGHLKRHGFSESDVDALAEFERKVAEGRRKRPAPAQDAPLDFGDWEA